MEYNDETGDIKLSEEEFNKLDKMIKVRIGQSKKLINK